MSETTSPEPGSLINRLRSAMSGNRHASDARLSPVTTFRDASPIPTPPATTDPLAAPGDGNGLTQPGENATELHPDDASAMAEREAADKRRSGFAAEATLSGAPTTHPINEPRYPGSIDIQTPQAPSDLTEK